MLFHHLSRKEGAVPWNSLEMNMVLERCPAERMPEHLLQNSISPPCVWKRHWEKCSLYISKAAPPRHTWVALPCRGRLFFFLQVSSLRALYDSLYPEESLQDNRKPTWTPAEGKGNQHCCEFCLISSHQSMIKMSQLQLAHSKEFIETRERQVAKFTEHLHNLLWFKPEAAESVTLDHFQHQILLSDFNLYDVISIHGNPLNQV